MAEEACLSLLLSAYLCVRVRVRVCACVRVRVRVRVRRCVGTGGLV